MVTIHPVVTFYGCPKCCDKVCESIVFISPDNKHDHNAVHAYMDLVAAHLQKRNIPIEMMLRYSDGCAAQYKSKGPLADISYSSSDYGFPMIHNFFGSRHGKGPSDGESAVIKSHVSTAVKNETVITGNARELYEYCVDALEKDTSDTACTQQS